MKHIKLRNHHDEIADIINRAYSRDKLRKLAMAHGIKRGQDKKDTIENILSDIRCAVHFNIRIEIGDHPGRLV